MRKWTYLVAALLMSGTAATFTSCIDTTEPAGIEEMRSAKADLLRQKAELQKALAEKQGIENQIAALNVELQQAINAWKMDSLKAKQDTLALSLETKLLEMQQLKAQADYNLQKALEQINVDLITMKDDIYMRELSYYKALLIGGKYYKEDGSEGSITTGALTDFSDAQNTLLGYKLDQIAYEAKKPTFKPRLEARKAKEEAELAIHKSLLETVEDLKAANTNDEAANTQLLAEKKNALKALDAKESEKIEAINEAVAALKPTANEIAAENEKLEKLEIYTITKTDALTKIGDELHTALSGYSSDIEEGFKETTPSSGEYELVSDIKFKAYNAQNRATLLYNVKNTIQTEYSSAYETAYNSLNIGSVTASDLLNEDGSIKEEYSSKIENEYERLKIDAEQVEEAYKAEQQAWLDAYKAYMAALYDYNNYINGQNYYDATEKAISDYNVITDPAQKTLEKANTLRVLVRTYIEKREKVDGAVSTATGSFYDTYKDALTDANKSAFDTYMTNYQTNNLLFGYSFNEKISTGKSNNDNCLLDKFIDATNKFLGSGASSLADCKEPKTVVNGTETTYVVPEGLEPVGTSNFKTYLQNQETISVIENIDTWVSAYQQLDKDYNTLNAFVEEVTGKITAAQNASLDKLEALWKLEVEAYLIKGSESTNLTQIWASRNDRNIEDNPYYSIYNSYSSNLLTEYSVLYSEITALEALLSGTAGTISFVYYDETTNSYVETDNYTVEEAIEIIQTQIENKEDDIAETTALIEMFDKYGFIGNSSSLDPTLTNCSEALANKVAEQEKIVNAKDAEIKRIEAIIEKLTTVAAQ